MESLKVDLYDLVKIIDDATGIVISDVIIKAPTVFAEIATVIAVIKVNKLLISLVFTPASLAKTEFIDVYKSP